MLPLIEIKRRQLQVICKVYAMTAAYHNTIISTDSLIKEVGIDEGLFRKIKNYLVNEGLLSSKYIGYTSIRHKGIREVENVLGNPTMDTNYFPAYCLNHIQYDESIIQLFYDLKTKRSQFLHKIYEVTEADEMRFVNAFDIGRELGFDNSDNNKIVAKVYEYLVQDGLIIYRSNGGGLSISHKGIIKVQEELQSPQDILPNKVVDELINSIDEINVLGKSKLGSKLFDPSPRELNNLRNISNSQEGFIAVILRIANIINSVYNDEIKKQVKENPPSGSINLIVQLFHEKNLNYAKEDIQTLRNLNSLRSTKQPVHNAEYKAIDILKSLGINYPPNWEKAGQTCLYNLLKSIKNLKEALRKY